MVRERLNDDLKRAMRAKDATRLAVIRGIKAAVLEAETKDRRTALEDGDIIRLIAKEVKERRDVMGEFERAGRRDLVDKARAEIAILTEYLPQPLSESELSRLVDQALQETGARGMADMKNVMAWLTPRIEGQAEGAAVAVKVKAALSRGS